MNMTLTPGKCFHQIQFFLFPVPDTNIENLNVKIHEKSTLNECSWCKRHTRKKRELKHVVRCLKKTVPGISIRLKMWLECCHRAIQKSYTYNILINVVRIYCCAFVHTMNREKKNDWCLWISWQFLYFAHPSNIRSCRCSINHKT